MLQERKVRRVGALKETTVDVKIISSVNVDPHLAMANGTLRSDLFYRLGVVFIHIVPLSQRMGDLERLVKHFIHKHNKRLGKQVQGMSANVLSRFRRYHWPGNVRELEHAIEGAMNIVGTGQILQLRHLQSHFSSPAPLSPTSLQPITADHRETDAPDLPPSSPAHGPVAALNSPGNLIGKKGGPGKKNGAHHPYGHTRATSPGPLRNWASLVSCSITK